MSQKPYKMPPVYLGDVVLWSHAPGGVPAAALVTAVGHDAINVIIFPPDSRGVPKDGVRNVHDPVLATSIVDSGVWRYKYSGPPNPGRGIHAARAAVAARDGASEGEDAGRPVPEAEFWDEAAAEVATG